MLSCSLRCNSVAWSIVFAIDSAICADVLARVLDDLRGGRGDAGGTFLATTMSGQRWRSSATCARYCCAVNGASSSATDFDSFNVLASKNVSMSMIVTEVMRTSTEINVIAVDSKAIEHN